MSHSPKLVFRQESLDRVKSPEQLNNFIKISKPSVWVITVSILFLLIGVIVWSVFGSVDTTIALKAVVKEDNIFFYVPESIASNLEIGFPVIVDDAQGEITEISDEPYKYDEVLIKLNNDEYLTYLLGVEYEKYLFEIKVDIANLDEIVVDADVVVDRINPISFVFN